MNNIIEFKKTKEILTEDEMVSLGIQWAEKKGSPLMEDEFRFLVAAEEKKRINTALSELIFKGKVSVKALVHDDDFLFRLKAD